MSGRRVRPLRLLVAALAVLIIASYALALYGPAAAQDGGDGVEQRGTDTDGGPEPKQDPDAPPGCYRHPDLGYIIVCPTASISANPTSIDQGHSSTLSWGTSYATSVSINQGIGAVGASGSRSVSPTSTTTYTVTNLSPAEAITESVTVTVRPPPPAPSNFRATDVSENSLTLRWDGIQHIELYQVADYSSDVRATSYPVTGLQPCTAYTFKVRAHGDGSIYARTWGAWSTASETTGCPRPTGSISADSTNIDRGQSTTLRWETQHATSVSINQGIGTVAASGSRSISPTSTATYTLSASGAGGSITRSVTVNVTIPRIPPTGSISADSTNIDIGQSTTLRWETQHATSVSINQGIGTVAASGSRSISPTSTATYTLSASGAGGSITRSVTVNVTIPRIPPTGSISADSTNIDIGQSTTLRWETQHATSVSINQGIGTVAASGSRSISPTSTATYTLSASGAGGSITRSVTVNVTIPRIPPTGSISADSTNIDIGQSTTLRWETQHATSVSINQGIGTVAASGSRSISPTSTTTYTLTASGPGGSLNPKPSETVNVGLPLPPAPSNFNATSASETSINLSWSPRDPIELYQVEHYSSEIRATIYRVPNLVCGTEYSFRVRAHGDGSTYRAAWGAWASASGTPECEEPEQLPLPPAPSNFNATSASETSINLSWSPRDPIELYQVEHYSSEIRATIYRVLNLVCGTEYSFRVRAHGDGSTYRAAWGAWASASGTPECEEPEQLPLPPAPSNFNATSASETSINLRWSPRDPIELYQVEHYSSEIRATIYRVLNLVCGTEYSFRVRAYGDGSTYAAAWGTSWASDSATTHACQSPPNVPTKLDTVTGLHVRPLPNRKVRLAWDQVDDADQYVINGFNQTDTEKEIDLDPLLSNADSVQYSVNAISYDLQFTEGDTSSIFIVDNPIVEIDGNSKDTDDAKGRALVKWKKIANATQYTIYYRKLAGNHTDHTWAVTSPPYPYDNNASLSWTPIRLSASDVIADRSNPLLLTHSIKGLEMYKIYGVYVDYEIYSDSDRSNKKYFAAREAYVWPSDRPAGGGERVATFPMNFPVTNRTYAYHICKETFPELKRTKWIEIIKTALKEWELATNGLVTTTYEVFSQEDVDENPTLTVGDGKPCATYMDFIGEVANSVEILLGADVNADLHEHVEGLVIHLKTKRIAGLTLKNVQDIDAALNEILMYDDKEGDTGYLDSEDVFPELSGHFGFDRCLSGVKVFACAVRTVNSVGYSADIVIRRSGYETDLLNIPEVQFNKCSTDPAVLTDAQKPSAYRGLVHEGGHVLGIWFANSGSDVHHPSIVDTIYSSVNLPGCSPHPFDVMAIFALYQTLR